LAQIHAEEDGEGVVKSRSVTKRRLIDLFVRSLSACAASVGVVFLGWILFVVMQKGLGSMSKSFFTELPTPPGMLGGGLANAILGSLLITILATFIGVPTGLCAGIYLAEFGRDSKLANLVRFTSNILMGMPSIIIGIFVFSLMITKLKHFSGLAGAVSLAIIMFPIVARTSEDMLNLVPNALRESALALGIPRWRAINNIVFRAAKSGLMTGILLAIARVTGETAPLLFTALNSPYWPGSLNEPMANLPVTIFNYAMSPYADWQEKAWGASFLIMVGVLGLTIAARIFLKERKR
jgi:phosphate transport system permease protein